MDGVRLLEIRVHRDVVETARDLWPEHADKVVAYPWADRGARER